MRSLLAIILAISTVFLSAESFAQTAPTFADCSIASLSGSSQALGTLFALGKQAYNRKYLLICNEGVTGDNLGVNLVGTTAALNGTGTITLVPGACLEYSSAPGSASPLPPSNSVNVIGTSGQPVLCYEGR